MAIIKVLCAEDDRLMRLEMKEKMTAKGWEVIEAVDGKEALVKYKNVSAGYCRFGCEYAETIGTRSIAVDSGKRFADTCRDL